MARYARVGIVVVGVLVIYKVNNGKIPHCAIVFWVVVGKTALAKRLLFQAYFFDFFFHVVSLCLFVDNNSLGLVFIFCCLLLKFTCKKRVF